MPNIFINPGHAPDGNPDPGACNPDTGLRECDVAYAIGEKVAGYLGVVGYDVKCVQSDDLAGVVTAANDWPAELFVSIHCNSADTDQARGTETWYCHNSDAGAKLADKIQSQIVNSIGTVDRGIKDATPGINGLYVLTNTDMPACLAETAFISNPDDEKLLADSGTQDEFARAIARGITDYFA